jgi:hypothetical protein
MKKYAVIVVAIVATMLTTGRAFAASLASDNAADAAYDDGWQSGDNGGTGWGGSWSLNTSSPPDVNKAGHFVGSSQGNGFADGNIDTAGRSWGEYANNNYVASGLRPFSGTLSIGQTFAIDLDNGFIDNGSSVGFTLSSIGDPGSTDQFSFFFRGGESNYKFSVGRFMWYAETDTGVPFTSAGLHVEYTLTGATSFTLAITPNGGSTTVLNGNMIISSPLTYVEVYNFNAGSGSANDAFFNNIAIIPEPTTALLVGIGMLATCLIRRRN